MAAAAGPAWPVITAYVLQPVGPTPHARLQPFPGAVAVDLPGVCASTLDPWPQREDDQAEPSPEEFLRALLNISPEDAQEVRERTPGDRKSAGRPRSEEDKKP